MVLGKHNFTYILNKESCSIWRWHRKDLQKIERLPVLADTVCDKKTKKKQSKGVAGIQVEL